MTEKVIKNQCKERCPKCSRKCLKNDGHSEHDGIAGLCWCGKCRDWYVPGETTIISERVSRPSAPVGYFPGLSGKRTKR